MKKTYLLVLSLCLLGGGLPLSAKVMYWTGKAGDHLWSNGGNWDPGLPPSAGDSLVFGDPDHDQGKSSDDLPLNDTGISFFRSIHFGSDTSTFTISTEVDLELSELVVDEQEAQVTVQANISIQDNGEINSAGTLRIAGHVRFGNNTAIQTNPGGIRITGLAFPANIYISSLEAAGELLADCKDNSSIGGGAASISVGPLSGTGNITAIVDGGTAFISFTGNGLSIFGGKVYLTTHNDGTILFDHAGIDGVAEIRNGDHVSLFLRPSHSGGGTNSAIRVVQGSQLKIGEGDSGGELIVNEVYLENVSSDDDPSIIDTGANSLRVNSQISAAALNSHLHPIIKGQYYLACH